MKHLSSPVVGKVLVHILITLIPSPLHQHILRTVRAHDSDSTMSAIHSTPALCATEVRTQYARDSIVSSIYNYLSMLHNEEKHHARNDTATRMEKTAAAL